MNPRQCAEASHQAVSRVGGAFMVDPRVSARAQQLGLSFFEFYIAGRAGVLGPADPHLVCAELAILNPLAVAAAWEGALAAVAPEEASAAYAECAWGWGEEWLSGLPDLARTAELAERLVDHLEVGPLPLVRGWQQLSRPSDVPARLAHLLQVLREFRGRVHLTAVSEAGLTPVEAIVSGPDGPARADVLGWPAPFPDPVPLRAARDRAEARTDELAAAAFAVLASDERADFAARLASLHAQVTERQRLLSSKQVLG